MKSKIQENQDGTMRALSNRHVQMIAIGGTIGTGLFLGSGSTISKTGPSVMLIYLVLGVFFFFMMRGIGEMFYSDPSQHTFVSFISRYLGPTVGHFTGVPKTELNKPSRLESYPSFRPFYPLVYLPKSPSKW